MNKRLQCGIIIDTTIIILFLVWNSTLVFSSFLHSLLFLEANKQQYV